MNMALKQSKGMCGLLFALLFAVISAGIPTAAQAASVEELERRIEQLERLLQDVKREQAEAARKEREEEAAMQELKEEVAKKSSGLSLTPEGSSFSIYGSIRPAVTYFSDRINDQHTFNYEIRNPGDSSSSVELTDFFTRVGVKGETDVGYGLTAFMKGEMEVAIDQNGQFDPRVFFVGIKGGFGRLAIGRQWHPHNNTIVGPVTDIYNHRSSPFGYDQQGPFRRPGLVTYSKGFDVGGGTLKLDSGLQFTSATTEGRGNDDRPAIDSGSIGLAFNNDLFYLGASYLQRKREDTDTGGVGTSKNSRDYYGIGASISPVDNLYLAVTAQIIKQDRDGQTFVTGPDPDDISPLGDDDGHSIDVVASYAFGDGYKVIAGWFDVDEAGLDASGCSNAADLSCDYTDGYSLTLQRQMTGNFRVFAEWIYFSYDDNGPGQEDEVHSLSTGFRYDFSLDVL